MCNMCNLFTKPQIRALAISLLTNEHGISYDSFMKLKDMLFAFGIHDIHQKVDATDDAYYLPEGWDE